MYDVLRALAECPVSLVGRSNSQYSTLKIDWQSRIQFSNKALCYNIVKGRREIPTYLYQEFFLCKKASSMFACMWLWKCQFWCVGLPAVKIFNICASDVKVTASLIAPYSRSVVLALSKTVKKEADLWLAIQMLWFLFFFHSSAQ